MMRSKAIQILVLSLAATTMWGQNSIRMDGGPSWKGFAIRFTPKVEPDRNGASNELGGTVIDLLGGIVGQRFIDDPDHKRSFAYDVRLIPAADRSAAEIRIEPLHAAKHAVDSGWTQFGLPTGLPKYPVIPDLRVGDTVALDLMVNPTTGQKIVDYLTLERAPVAVPAHDFSLADVRLSLDQPSVLVDGETLATSFPASVGGKVVWIYLEGHGRFVLSLFPSQKRGFQKNGTIAGNVATFRDGAEEIRMECKSPITPGEGPYNLYIVHEAAWRPRRSDVVQVGAADSPELVIGGAK